MDRYMANKPNFVQGHLPVARSIVSGKKAATLDASSSTWRFKRQGEPIEVAFSAEDETPVFTVTGGIFKDAPHPNAAKLYLTWYLAQGAAEPARRRSRRAPTCRRRRASSR